MSETITQQQRALRSTEEAILLTRLRIKECRERAKLHADNERSEIIPAKRRRARHEKNVEMMKIEKELKDLELLKRNINALKNGILNRYKYEAITEARIAFNHIRASMLSYVGYDDPMHTKLSGLLHDVGSILVTSENFQTRASGLRLLAASQNPGGALVAESIHESIDRVEESPTHYTRNGKNVLDTLKTANAMLNDGKVDDELPLTDENSRKRGRDETTISGRQGPGRTPTSNVAVAIANILGPTTLAKYVDIILENIKQFGFTEKGVVNQYMSVSLVLDWTADAVVAAYPIMEGSRDEIRSKIRKHFNMILRSGDYDEFVEVLPKENTCEGIEKSCCDMFLNGKKCNAKASHVRFKSFNIAEPNCSTKKKLKFTDYSSPQSSSSSSSSGLATFMNFMSPFRTSK